MLMQQLGPMNNPLVNFEGYYNTLEQMLAIAGFKDVSQFFQNPQNFQPPQPTPPPPSPEQILAQVQAQSIQADIQKKAAELELQREEMLLKDDRERDKLDAEVMLKSAEIEVIWPEICEPTSTVTRASITPDADTVWTRAPCSTCPVR
jgi:hypothetical protein